MFLKRIRLQNIRSYIEGEIDFKQGIVLLSGDIGCGKSTILLAIEFALFGILRGDLSGTTLLRHGKIEGSVELHFDMSGKEIIIRRYLKKSSTGIKQDAGYIIIDGVKTDGTAIELKTRILSLMGYPEELLTKSKSMIYRYTVYTPQESMKQILFEEKEERLNTLRRVFGIDKYKRIVENTGIVTSKIKLDKKEIVGRIQDLDRKRIELAEKEKRMLALQEDFEKASASINHLMQESAEKKKEFTIIEQEKNLLEKLKSEQKIFQDESARKKDELARLEGETLRLKKEIAEQKEAADGIIVEHVFEDEKDLEKDLILLSNEKESFTLKKNELLQKANYIREQIEQKKQLVLKKEAQASAYEEKKSQHDSYSQKILSRQAREKDLLQSEKEIEEISANLKAQEIRKEELQNAARKVANLIKCPFCQQEVHESHKRGIKSRSDQDMMLIDQTIEQLMPGRKKRAELILVLKREIDELREIEKKISILKVELKTIEDAKKEAEEEKQIIMKLSEKEAEYATELLKHDDAKLLAYQEKMTKLEDALKKIREQKTLAEKKKGMLAVVKEKEKILGSNDERIRIISQETAKLASEIKQREEETAKRRSIGAEFDQKRKEVESMLQIERDLEKSKSSIETESKMTLKIKQDLESEIAAKEEDRRKLERLTLLQTFFETDFINLMLSMEKHIMVSIHREFTELFRKWFSLLVEDDILDARLDEDFSPVIIQNGYENEVSNLSGGEKTAIALAYRLALNKVINDLISTIKTKDIIILDEPTDGFSEEQLDKVRDVLDELKMRQIILVSHESKIEGFCDSIVRIVKRGHESRIMQ